MKIDVSIAALLLVAGCTSEDPAECAAGFDLGEDGLCYQQSTDDEPPTFNEFLAGLAECDATEGDGSIDLWDGCANGLCIGDPYADWTAELGEPECFTVFFDSQFCFWFDVGLSATFEDAEAEQEFPLPTDVAGSVFIDDPFAGATPDGLGLGAAVSCFTEALGAPSNVEMERGVGALWLLSDVRWDEPRVSASDLDGDGLIDSIAVFDITPQ